MAIVLQTNTVLNIVDDDFTLVTNYSGETNPNVTYTYTLTVTDTNTNVIVGATVTINSVEYTTDVNGQVIVDLERGDYVASISKTGYMPDTDTFTILDANVSNNVQLGSVGSFDDSFDNSFDDLKSYTVYDDWFLPSKDELEQMYINLYLEGVGDFSAFYYWSSSEGNATLAWSVRFTDGSLGLGNKSSLRPVRACRSFTDELGVYSLRDVGPAGGLIFYIDGTTYYEAALSDQSISQTWSNIISTLIGTTGTVIGTGQANTTAIINQAGHTDSAALLCDELVVNN